MHIQRRFDARGSSGAALALVAAVLVGTPALAADVSLAADDGIGTSSFNTGLHWGDGLAPSAGNSYFTGNFVLRTPPDGASHTFSGDSLTVNNTTPYPDGLLYKGTGTTGIITIGNLILDGGIIAHANGVGDRLQLDGTITVNSASTIHAKQGNIDILADISGPGDLVIPVTDVPGEDNRYVSLFATNASYAGSLHVAGRFRLESSGGLNFLIGAAGVNTSVTGSGTAVFDGTFTFSLTGVTPNLGDNWTIADVGNQTFGPNFTVAGYTESPPGVWTRRGYRFSESNGVLTYGIEPATALTPITLTGGSNVPNGAWSWFEDERCIIDADAPGGPRLLVSSVSSAANGDPESGDIDLTWLDLVSGTTGHFEFADRLQRDDHDSAALWIRPDGRYIATYAKHTADPLTRWRISTHPHDPTAWGAEQTYTHPANTTYSNLHYLPDDDGGAGRLYNFTRAINWDPTVMTSSDHGATWGSGGKLMTMGGSSDRPYVRYFSNGDRIHFITTEEHPRDYDNSIYHGYVKDGVAYDSDGVVVDANVFDSIGANPTAFTTVMATGQVFGDAAMRHAWTIDVAIDGDDPVAMFIARANGLTSDHRFLYGRYTSENGWTVSEIGEAGAYLYAAEDDYTGLGAIDPDDPNVIVISTDIDPRDGRPTPSYELYEGRTDDGGATWSWIALTEDSSLDNLRPLIPQFKNGFERVIVWMRGGYASYSSWTTDIVVMKEIVPDRIRWACLSGPGNTSLPLGCPAEQFASLDRDGDGDVDLLDAAGFLAENRVLRGAP